MMVMESCYLPARLNHRSLIQITHFTHEKTGAYEQSHVLMVEEDN